MDQLKLFVDLVLHHRYQITRQLGRGGMGAVYEATDLKEKRQVAIKQMLPLDLDLRMSFEREAKILSEVEHEGLPRVTDFFENETGLFMVMDYFAGENLGQLLDSRKMPFAPHQVRRWAVELLDVLEYLHGRDPRVIHRDIKPSNLKLTSQGRLILLDFGLAKELSEEDERNGIITNACILAYTPHYAPLEQIQGEGTSPSSDLYALGATLYHLLTGQPPTDALKRANRILCDGRDPLAPVSQVIHGIPLPLSALVMKALALKPSSRPSSATEMRAQLQSGVIAPDFSRNTNPLAIPPASAQPEVEAVTQLARASAGVSAARIVASAGSSHISASPVNTSPGKSRERGEANRVSITFPARPITLSPAWAGQSPPRQVIPIHEVEAAARLKDSQKSNVGTKLRAVGRAAGTLLTLAFVAFSAVVFYHSDFNPLRTDRRYNWKLSPKITASDDDRADIAREAPAPVYRPKTDRRRNSASPALYVEEPEPVRRELTIDELIRLNNQTSSRNKRPSSAPRIRRTSSLDSESLHGRRQARQTPDGEGFY